MVRVDLKQQPKESVQDELIRKQKGKCYYCDDKVFGKEATDYAVFDHVQNFKQSHNNMSTNYVLCCNRCNMLKRDFYFDNKEEARWYLRDMLGLPQEKFNAAPSLAQKIFKLHPWKSYTTHRPFKRPPLRQQ